MINLCLSFCPPNHLPQPTPPTLYHVLSRLPCRCQSHQDELWDSGGVTPSPGPCFPIPTHPSLISPPVVLSIQRGPVLRPPKRLKTNLVFPLCCSSFYFHLVLWGGFFLPQLLGIICANLYQNTIYVVLQRSNKISWWNLMLKNLLSLPLTDDLRFVNMQLISHCTRNKNLFFMNNKESINENLFYFKSISENLHVYGIWPKVCGHWNLSVRYISFQSRGHRLLPQQSALFWECFPQDFGNWEGFSSIRPQEH